MIEDEDQVVITIAITRNKNGTVSTEVTSKGKGFFTFEIIGLLTMYINGLVKQSQEAAKKIQEEHPDGPRITPVYNPDNDL